MEKQIKKIIDSAMSKVAEAQDANTLNDLRVKYLGKKGEFTAVLRGMKDLTAEQRPVIGGMVNKFKEKLELFIFHNIEDKLPQIIVDETFSSNKGMIFIEAPETELVIDKAKSLRCYSHKIVVRISDNEERFQRVFNRNPYKTFFDVKEIDNAQIDSELEEGDILINNDSRDLYDLKNQINELILNEKHQWLSKMP